MHAGEPGLGLRIDRHVAAVPTRDAGNVRLALVVARNRTGFATRDCLARDWLRGEECDRYDRFKVPAAKTDFLAGRIAAKTAIGMLASNAPPTKIEIQRGVWHQPCLRGSAAPGIAVTLAHSGGIGIAAAFDDRLRCGIDLEMRAHDAADAVATQVSDAEKTWARADPGEDNPRWMLLWTAREALGKCLGSGLLFNERLPATVAWTEDEAGWRTGFEGTDLLEARSIVAPGCVCTIVLSADPASQSAVDASAAWLAKVLA